MAGLTEDKEKYKEGTIITVSDANALFDKDYSARAVNIPGLNKEQNEAVTDAWYKFADTKEKIEKTYNSFEGDKASFVLKGSATRMNRVKRLSVYSEARLQ